jgi:insertion element IS1 protein InsB
MIMREACPQCGSIWFKRNGHIHTGKQNHRCKMCGRAFVLNPENSALTEEQPMLIERLLLERISLRGICRAVGVGIRWLLQFMSTRFREVPDHLNVMPPVRASAVIMQRLEAEVDELWGALSARKQTVNGSGSQWTPLPAKSLRSTWAIAADRAPKPCGKQIPAVYQERATFYTDQYEVYKGVIPSTRHRAISKLARKTNQVERFNCTLRQRVSRLVRATLAFSKDLAKHIGAIKYFICDYNLTRSAALPG